MALGALAGSLLKTVPFAGHLAGGALQGVVQALITKWVGAVFVEYFRNEMRMPEGGLAGLQDPALMGKRAAAEAAFASRPDDPQAAARLIQLLAAVGREGEAFDRIGSLPAAVRDCRGSVMWPRMSCNARQDWG